jgi:DNA replication protein DnaC
MSETHPELRLAAIRQQCKQLQLPAVGAQAGRLAAQADTAHHSHLAYLEALLGAEVDERERRAIDRRLREAHFPRVKTLEEFDFAEAPTIPAATLRTLAEGAYLARAEPVLFLGETGTGKTHLATGLAVAACRQRRRVRFTTAAALVNDLVEAQHQHQLSRVTNRWAHCDLIVIDELGYVALAEVGAELLFQLIAERAEKAAVIATTNLPFSEWTTVFPNARLCKALLDRLTDRAHIIETGTESYRFRRTLEQRQTKGPRLAAPARPKAPPEATGDHPTAGAGEDAQRPLPASPGRSLGSARG